VVPFPKVSPLSIVYLLNNYQRYIVRPGYRAIGMCWEGSVRGLFQDTLGDLPGVSRGTEKDDTPSEILPNKGSGKYSTFQIFVNSLEKKLL
jgi:hypothetical protein